MSVSEIDKAAWARPEEPRMLILWVLVQMADTGLRLDEIGERTRIPMSSLMRHLTFLSDARLIRQKDEGRYVIGRPRLTYLAAHSAINHHETRIEMERKVANDR